MGEAASLGEALRAARTARGRSIRQVALRAGVSRSNLSRWETSISRPQREETECVLAALGLTLEERTSFWNAVPPEEAQPERTPRIRMFQAARIRSGLSASAAAERVGVTRATLSRWESGSRWPGSERLAEAARSIGATQEEWETILQMPNEKRTSQTCTSR